MTKKELKKSIKKVKKFDKCHFYFKNFSYNNICFGELAMQGTNIVRSGLLAP